MCYDVLLRLSLLSKLTAQWENFVVKSNSYVPVNRTWKSRKPIRNCLRYHEDFDDLRNNEKFLGGSMKQPKHE